MKSMKYMGKLDNIPKCGFNHRKCSTCMLNKNF